MHRIVGNRTQKKNRKKRRKPQPLFTINGRKPTKKLLAKIGAPKNDDPIYEVADPGHRKSTAGMIVSIIQEDDLSIMLRTTSDGSNGIPRGKPHKESLVKLHIHDGLESKREKRLQRQGKKRSGTTQSGHHGPDSDRNRRILAQRKRTERPLIVPEALAA